MRTGIGPDLMPNRDSATVPADLFEAVFNRSNAAMVVADDDGRYIVVNEAASSLFGLPRDELVGRRVAEFAAEPEAVPGDWQSFRATSGRDGEFALRRADGVVLAVEYSAVPDAAPGYHVSILRDVSERKRHEAERLAAEQRYRELVELANDMIYTMNMDGRILSAGGAVERFLGYTEEEFCRLQMEDILPPEALGEMAERRDRRAAGDTGLSRYEVPLVRRDGRRVWSEVVTRLVRRADGEMMIHGVARDIEDRRKAEAALRESQERFRMVVEALPTAVWLTDGERLLLVNSAMLELSGYTEEEVTSPGFLGRWLNAEDAVMVAKRGRARLQGEDPPASYRVRVRSKGGEQRWVEVRAERIVHEGEVAILVAGIDVTAQRAAEESLRQSADRLRSLLEGIPVSTWIFDGEQVVFVNAAVERLTGYDRAQLVSPGFFADAGIIHRDDEAAMIARGEARIRGDDEPEQYEVRLVRSDGEVRPVEIHARRIELEGRAVSLVTAIDLGERRRIEEERIAFEGRLQQAQKLESLGLLAGGVAHDFNNLLVGILGNADLALHESDTAAPVRDSLEEIMLAAQRAADLTRQMLAYSGKGRFVIQQVDLAAVVEEIAALVEASISKKVMLRFKFAPELPPVEADATQIQQIAMNLIINAADAIGDAQGVVTVSTGVTFCDRDYLRETYLDADLPEGEYVYFEVSDTGAGMDEETQQRIFDPFFTTKFTGRGLGLAAVLGIVRGHRGAIKVYSEPGRGSTFKVLFPPATAGTADAAPATDGDGTTWRGTGLALVVDDDRAVGSVTASMLRNMGFATEVAEDGESGLALFRERSREVSLVVLDLTMPNMDGAEVFQRLRRVRPDVRVILVSGYNEQEATSRFVGKGLAAFMQKPFRYAEFVSVVQAVMAGERGSQPGV